jgi:hypothetical protein
VVFSDFSASSTNAIAPAFDLGEPVRGSFSID